MHMDFDFVRKAKTLPVITTPEGVSHQLEFDSRVPIWPLCRARDFACSGTDVATAEGAAVSDQPSPAAPVQRVESGEESPPLTKSGEKSLPPPKHYLTHDPKHPGCEVCQKAKLAGLKCTKKANDPDKRSPDSLVANAKEFVDLITADHEHQWSGGHRRCGLPCCIQGRGNGMARLPPHRLEQHRGRSGGDTRRPFQADRRLTVSRSVP